jgi:transposase InsO family protein
MPRPAKLCPLPLPRGWPRRVRSAVVQVISLVRTSLALTHGWASESLNPELRQQAEEDRLRQEIQLLREEIRIKDSRMEQLEAHRRPHYPPTARLAILELRAARGWTLAQTARIFLVSPLTIASWMGHLDEEGPDALVRLPEPVNKFPDFVAYLVKRLKILCPTLGKVKTSQILARAGLHLGPTTVRRMQRDKRWPEPRKLPQSGRRVVSAKRPNHLWHVDLTTVPTAWGFWVSWLPFALPQVWPFSWWLAVAIDHYSRRLMGFAVYRALPSSTPVRRFLEEALRRTGATPAHFITDQGTQFTEKGFRRWCRRHGIGHRFGALGKYGSLAVIERGIRTIKSECTRRLSVVPYRLAGFEHELTLYFCWFNGSRPHTWLQGATPEEAYYRHRQAIRAPRFEPRPRWPRKSPCASPRTLIRGQPGATLDLEVRYLSGRQHLPTVTLKRVA